MLVAATTTIAMSMTAQELKYPQARKDGTVDEYFGQKVEDPYRWMEDDRSAETAAWVEAENRVTEAYLRQLPQRAKLEKRMKELCNYSKVGAPFYKHGHWYQYRNDGLQNQAVVYRLTEDNRGYEGTEVRGYENCSSAESSLAPSHPRTLAPTKSTVFLDPNQLSDDGTVDRKSVV